jgi:predicted SAM-dependent methyltransferase
MVKLMKSTLKKVIRMMAGWPVIGRFVRFGIRFIRWMQMHYVFQTAQLPSLLKALSDLNHRQLSIENDRDNLVKSVPVALRAMTRDLVEMREQLKNLSNSSDYLSGRVEFIRRELMFEMRYGRSPAAVEDEQIAAAVQILSPEKLAAAFNEGVRINLGCGHIPLNSYLNIDRRALPGVDIVSEVDQLPFESGDVNEIYSAHLLEHFPKEQLRRELLPYFFNLLKEGGEFRAIVPDAEAMIREYSIGQYSYDDMRDVIYGGQDYEGDFHFNMFTPTSLHELLHEAGFKNITIVESARNNGKCFEFEISAIKLIDSLV